MAAGQGSESMDVEEYQFPSDTMGRGNNVPESDIVTRIIPRDKITDFTKYDAIHTASFGVPFSSTATQIPRIFPAMNKPARQQWIVDARQKSDDELIGFFLASVSEDKTVDIWSVCKSKTTTTTRLVERLFAQFVSYVPDAVQISLVVDPTNNETMTELGRLLLYTSLSFQLAPGIPVQDMLGNQYIVLEHKDGGNTVVVQHSSGKRMTLYVGVIRSLPGIPLKMATNSAGIRQGKRKLLHTDPKYAIPIRARNNFKDAVFPYPTDPYVALYHGGLQKTSRGVLESFRLPSNVTLITVTMPGSVLHTNIGRVRNLAKMIVETPVAYSTFVKKFPGYSAFPIGALDLEKLRELKSDLAATLATAIFALQFERRRILTQCISGDPTVRQTQYDFQAYAPGMECLNYDISVDLRPDSNDARTGAGTYSKSGKIPDFDALVEGKTTLKTYIDALVAKHPPSAKITLFFFACAIVNDRTNFSLFYELSHRRSLNYTIPYEGFPESIRAYLTTPTGIPSPLLLRCPPVAGGRKPRVAKRMTNVSGRPLFEPTRKVRRSSSSSKKRYTRRQKASRS